MRPRAALLLILAVACIACLPGLTRHGLTNWQESQRLLAARSMHERGEWLIPRIHAEPYLAKPPAFYWLIRGFALVRAGAPQEFDLRLAVAICGIIGPLLVFALAREVAQTGRWTEPDRTAAGLLAALSLSTAPLFARSARIGELDILLAVFAAAGLYALARAYRSHLERQRTAFGWVAAAALASIGAALTKGPPGILAPACAYAGLLAHTISVAPRGHRLRALWYTLHRTHIVGVLGIGLLAYWGWLRLCILELGPVAVRLSVAAEAEDNIHLLTAAAPLKYLEALSYGGGLASLAFMGWIVWIVRDRPRLDAGAWIVGAAAILPPILLSLTTKGVPRYLTPIWPAMAVLTGYWLASLLQGRPRFRPLRPVLVAVLAASGLALGVWYGYGREHLHADRSPRALIAELRPALLPGEPVYAMEFWTGALDIYSGGRVVPIGDTSLAPAMMGGPSIELAGLAAELHADPAATAVILAREAQPPRLATPAPVRQFADAGLIVEVLDLRSAFAIDSGRARIRAFRVFSGGRRASPAPGS